MADRFGIDDHTRFLVLFLDGGMKGPEISERIQRPDRTVRDWVAKTKLGIDIREVAEGRGTKPTITPAQENKIVRQVRETPQKASTRRLAAKDNMAKSSVHRILKRKGLKYTSYSSLPELTFDQECDRMAFCEGMTMEDGDAIYETFYADEMGIKLSEAQIGKGWHRPGEKVTISKPVVDVKLNCWGAISSRGATSLEIYKENLDGDLYQDILIDHIPEMEWLYPNGFYFVHDNHTAHNAANVWMDDNNFRRLLFPTYSPDLNIIENLWSALKDSVTRDAPSTEPKLISSLKRNWEILTTPENLLPYFENLHSRYFDCIEEEGARLPS